MSRAVAFPAFPALLALLAVACAPETTAVIAPPPVAEVAPPLPPPPPKKRIAPLGASDPRLVVVEQEPRRVADDLGYVVLRGDGIPFRRGTLVPLVEGGALVCDEVQRMGPSRLVLRRGRNGRELLLPSGERIDMDGATVYAVDPYVFVQRGASVALLDATTAKEIGKHAPDPALGGDRYALPIQLALGGTRLVERLYTGADGQPRPDEVRFSRVPELASQLVRTGALGAIAGRLALVVAPSKIEIVDLSALAVVETVRAPKGLGDEAVYALSSDGGRVAVARRGGLQVFERASKRWKVLRPEVRYAKNDWPGLTSAGFTADGKTLCLVHEQPFLFPPAPAQASLRQRVLFAWDRRSPYDRPCRITATPRIDGFEPLVDEGFRSQIQHVGSAESLDGSLGAFLDVEAKGPDEERGREVRLTVVEMPSGRVRFQIPVGRWRPSAGSDLLTVEITPKGVQVDATSEGDSDTLGGLFDPQTGKRLAPMWIEPPRARPLGFADLVARAGVKAGKGWATVKVEGGRLTATDAKGRAHVLGSEPPLPTQVRDYRGDPEAGATVVWDGERGWIFSHESARGVATMMFAGSGLVAFLSGGAHDLRGSFAEGSLGCLSGDDRLLPRASCAGGYVQGAIEDALAGKVTWLEPP
jgi:hypothetical protein